MFKLKFLESFLKLLLLLVMLPMKDLVLDDCESETRLENLC